jgi:hypothetical protein
MADETLEKNPDNRVGSKDKIDMITEKDGVLYCSIPSIPFIIPGEVHKNIAKPEDTVLWNRDCLAWYASSWTNLEEVVRQPKPEVSVEGPEIESENVVNERIARFVGKLDYSLVSDWCYWAVAARNDALGDHVIHLCQSNPLLVGLRKKAKETSPFKLTDVLRFGDVLNLLINEWFKSHPIRATPDGNASASSTSMSTPDPVVPASSTGVVV